MQQQAIHYAENGGIRADAQREGQHGNDGEPWILQEHANGVAQVLQERSHAIPPLSRGRGKGPNCSIDTG